MPIPTDPNQIKIALKSSEQFGPDVTGLYLNDVEITSAVRDFTLRHDLRLGFVADVVLVARKVDIEALPATVMARLDLIKTQGWRPGESPYEPLDVTIVGLSAEAPKGT